MYPPHASTSPVFRAVRQAIDNALFELVETEGAGSDAAFFNTQLRHSLQRVVTSSERLAAAADACDAEMRRHRRESDIDRARAALELKRQLPEICRPQRRFGWGPDGDMRPLD